MRHLHHVKSVHIKVTENPRPDLASDEATSESSIETNAEAKPAEEEYPRPFKGDTLREILDEEFTRNHRFDGITHLFTDLKGFLKNFVEREDVEVEGLGRVERET